MNSLGFSIFIYMIMSSVKDSFISLFPVQLPFISISCVIILARTSGTFLNSSGESMHSCFVPDLWKNLSTFTIEYVKYGFSYAFYHVKV